jgi:cold shock CspA family protein
VSPKKRQQTFEKMKREQAVRERRERKQEAKKAARELKAAARAAGGAPEGEGEASTGQDGDAGSLELQRGVVSQAVTEAGYGFIEPDDRGGQLLMRASEIDRERPLVVGEPVEYALEAGSLGVEAVFVKPLEGADR